MLGGVAAFGGTQGWFDKGLPSLPNQNLSFDVGNPFASKFEASSNYQIPSNFKLK